MNWPVFVTGLVVMAAAGVLFRYRVPYAKRNREALETLPLLGRRSAAASTPRMVAVFAAVAFALGGFALVLSFFSQG